MELAFKIFSSGLAAIATWFIWDLIREFKLFKAEAKAEMLNLKLEREEFKAIVRDAKDVISTRVLSLERIHHSYNLEVTQTIRKMNAEFEKLQNNFSLATQKVSNFELFFKKMLAIIKGINDRVKKSEAEISSVKIELGQVTIIKGEKPD